MKQHKKKTYKANTKKAVESIVKYVNIPVKYKRVSLLFGAGINFNIADNAKNWNELSLDSMKDYLANSNRQYTKFEINSIAKTMVESTGNSKISLAFNDRKLKLSIDPLPREDNEWFIRGYKKLIQMMNENVNVYTLNYDRVLDKILGKKSINFLNESSSRSGEEIIHLHGVVDKNDVVISPSLLTISDYVKHAKQVEDKLINHLTKPEKEGVPWYDTIIIIGSSLGEEHLLRAFNKFRENSGLSNVILVTHQPIDKLYFKALKGVYEKLGIEVVNINTGQKYKDDFIDFWTLLSKSIERKSSISVFEEISTRTDLIDNELYWKIKSSLDSKLKNISLVDFFQQIKWKDKNNTSLIRPIYWLEKNDGILSKGSLKKFMFNYLQKIPLGWLHMIEGELNSSKDIHLILEIADKNLKSFTNFGYDSSEYEIERFITNAINIIDFQEIKKYKNIIIFLVKKSISRYGRLNDELREVTLRNVSYSEINDVYFSAIHINEYPKKGSETYRLFENDFNKNKNPLNLKDPKSEDEFLNMLEICFTTNSSWKIMTLFSFKKYQDYVFKYQDKLISLLNKKIENDYDVSFLYKLHSIMYFVFMKSIHKEKYLYKIKNMDYRFDEFPRDMDLLGHGGTDTKAYTIFDGDTINKDEKYIVSSLEEVRKLMSEHYIPKKIKNAIIMFFRKEWSFKFLREFIAGEFKSELQNWNHFHKLETITIKCADWEEYKKYMEIYDDMKISYHQLSFIEIFPPFNVFKRIADLTTPLYEEYNKLQYSELLEIMEIKILQKHYNKEKILWNNDVRIAIKYYKKNEKTIKILNNILNYAWNWPKNKFLNLIEKKPTLSDFRELEFCVESGIEFQVPNINEIIKLHKNGENEFSDTFFRIVDHIIRTNKDRNRWNKDFTFLIHYLKKEKKTKEEEANTFNWIKIFKSKIAFNIITKNATLPKEANFSFNATEVTEAIKHMENPAKWDKKIVSLLDKINDFSSVPDIFYILRILEFKKIGPLTTEWYFKELMSTLKTYDEDNQYHDFDDVKEFIKYLDKEKGKKLQNKINKITST